MSSGSTRCGGGVYPARGCAGVEGVHEGNKEEHEMSLDTIHLHSNPGTTNLKTDYRGHSRWSAKQDGRTNVHRSRRGPVDLPPDLPLKTYNCRLGVCIKRINQPESGQLHPVYDKNDQPGLGFNVSDITFTRPAMSEGYCARTTLRNET